MLREGMGTTYEQAGAAYGPYTKEDFLAEELVAKYVLIILVSSKKKKFR